MQHGRGFSGRGGSAGLVVVVVLPFASVGWLLCVHPARGGGGGSPPRVFIYLLFAVSADSGLSSPLREPGFHFES